ncbi:MAG TPA: glycosyltransferase [Mucilaginibacter sp.]
MSSAINRIPDFPPVIEPVPSDIIRPLWSVMIPTYNCISYVKRTIESVLAQDPGRENMQIKVIDDFSTDGDIGALVKRIGKGRVEFFQQECNKGSLRNFETCLNHSKGHYVHILHGDDIVYKGFYQEIENLSTLFPEAGASFTNFTFIDHNDRDTGIINPNILEEPGVVKDLLVLLAGKQMIQPPAMVVKRTTYESVGSFYAVHFGEDWEMWARIAAKFPVAYSPKNLAGYRIGHGAGISYESMLTGQNLFDIAKVIDIIQDYLPAEIRQKYKKMASEYYAIYCIRIANSLLLTDKKAAYKQIEGAWKMSKSPKTLFWILRFYMLLIFRLKQMKQYYLQIKSSSY